MDEVDFAGLEGWNPKFKRHNWSDHSNFTTEGGFSSLIHGDRLLISVRFWIQPRTEGTHRSGFLGIIRYRYGGLNGLVLGL